MSQYLIIGASAGAIGAVEGIRSLNPKGKITVVSEETLAPYSRPSISEYLDGRISEDALRFGSDNFWDQNNVKTILGRRVISLDVKTKKLNLDDGQRLSFDKLLLATGAQPIIPKMKGTDKDGFCTFSNIADVQEIRARLSNVHRSVVIGGGLIGLAVAEALVNLGIDVAIVELRNWLLNLLLDREAAGIIESEIRNCGVRIITGQSVQEVLGNNHNDSTIGGVVLSSGERFTCELVVTAIGVVPRTELAIQAGLKVNRGIDVNRFMETSALDVYACGDAVEAYDCLKGTNQVLALWPLARLEGRIAGLNMAGDKVEYRGGVLMSALRYFGIPIISVGITTNESMECEVLSSMKRRAYRKIVLRNEEIVGFTLIGNIEAAGIFNNLLQTRVKISKFKNQLLDESFGFAHLPEYVQKRTLMEALT